MTGTRLGEKKAGRLIQSTLVTQGQGRQYSPVSSFNARCGIKAGQPMADMAGKDAETGPDACCLINTDTVGSRTVTLVVATESRAGYSLAQEPGSIVELKGIA